MARRSSHTSPSRRSRNNKKKSSSKFLYIGIAILAVAIVGTFIWWMTRTKGYQFQRADLDEYVEISQSPNLLEDGASVYVDMSDGMNFAYSTPESKAILQSVINKLAAVPGVDFFSLADQKITPLEMSHTELYNYMLSPGSYSLQRAPIESTLKDIVSKRKPALMMTDFEEYKGSVIEQAAYAKESFINWLAMGYNITFYKWAFTENGKQKLMFLAVFDDNANRLGSMVETAVRMAAPTIETYVLGSRDFAYPTSTQYLSLKQGGNYHNSVGVDAVTAVSEKGGKEDYVSYSKPFASSTGTAGQFAPLDISLGEFAEYYPLGVRWADAIHNAKQRQAAGVPSEEQFTHLLRNLYVDFGSQDGFAIDNIEVRVFDMQETMKYISGARTSGDSISIKVLDGINRPEINMVFTAGMEANRSLPAGWKEIFVDFDEKFDGTFMGGNPATNLLRANIVISRATADIAKATSFFSWEGNPSLANSVKETLTASSSNPIGRILYTYYIKTLSE